MKIIKRDKLVNLLNRTFFNKQREIKVVTAKGNTYQIRYHRERFWYDLEKINIKTFLSKFFGWHFTFNSISESGNFTTDFITSMIFEMFPKRSLREILKAKANYYDTRFE